MFRHARTWAMLLVVTAVPNTLLAQDLPDRGVKGSEAKIKVPVSSGIVKAVSNPPALFFISKNQRCTSFDLKAGTLNYVATNLVQVYPLVYLGKVGDIHIFWEASPYGWLWYFQDKGSNIGAVYYQEAPAQPIREFDTTAATAVRTP